MNCELKTIKPSRRNPANGRMERLILTLIVLLLPFLAIAQEPAWWTQKKRECGITDPYNTWVAKGMPCYTGQNTQNSVPVKSPEEIMREQEQKDSKDLT